MELGEKIRAARLEAGLSQRQLCGDTITRNMLSQIENGSARPSMDTLRYLAGRLGKSLSYFLEDEAVTSPNQAVMADARAAWARKDFAAVGDLLAAYRGPDPVFDQEFQLLQALDLMALAKQAIGDARLPYAEDLLEQAGDAGAASFYYTPALERERLLLLAQASAAPPAQLAALLPADDRELLLRAASALEDGDHHRAAVLLEAAQDRASPLWNLHRGNAHFAAGEFSQAAACYHRCEDVYPRQALPRLEACYRELGDFKLAYEYACKQR